MIRIFRATLHRACAVVLSSGANHLISWLVLWSHSQPDCGFSDMPMTQGPIEDDENVTSHLENSNLS